MYEKFLNKKTQEKNSWVLYLFWQPMRRSEINKYIVKLKIYQEPQKILSDTLRISDFLNLTP